MSLQSNSDALAAVRWIYAAVATFGVVAIACVLVRVRRATGVQPVTLFRLPDAGELARTGGLVGFIALYLVGTYFPSLPLFRPLWPMGPVGIGAGTALVLVGGLIYFTAVFTLGNSFRIGGDPGGESKLVTRGIYGRIRHPIYSAILVELAGMAVMYPCALSLVALPLALAGAHLQSVREERWWLARHEAEYRPYLRRTGRFVPRFR